jgi:hypothetical protein
MPTIKLRRGSRDQWTASNPILADGEMGVELDTGLLKVGNGFQHWDHLPYFYPNVSRLDLVRLEDRINQGLSEMVMEDISDVAFTTLQDGEAIVWSVDPVRGDAFRNINLDSKYVLQNQIGNLLTPNQASPKTTEGWFPSGVSLTVVGPDADGDLAIRATHVAGSAGLWVGGSGTTEEIPITEGDIYTVRALLRSNNNEAQQFIVHFKSTSGQQMQQLGSPVQVKTAEWSLHSFSFTAPKDSAFASVRLITAHMNAGDWVEIKKVGFWKGLDGDWAMPGIPIQNINPTARVSRPNVTDLFIESKLGDHWVMNRYDSGWRDAGPLLEYGWKATAGWSYNRIRRVNNMICLQVYLDGREATNIICITDMPQGFKPISGATLTGAWHSVNAHMPGMYQLAMNPALKVQLWDSMNIPATTGIGLHLVYFTDDPIPNSLPTTPVGITPTVY